MVPRPSVSVAMATYNGARYVQEQLERIFAQTYLLEDNKLRYRPST